MKKKSKKTVSIIIIVIIAVAIGFTYFVGKSVFNGVTNPISREQTVKNMSFYKDEYKEFEKAHDVKKIRIASTEFGHNIPALYVSENKNKDIAVLIHGMGGTKESLSNIANIFLDMGFDTIMYDQRNSGKNMANYSTFGVLESYDAIDVLNFAKSQVRDDGKVLLFGESYGGATALIAASRNDKDIDYLVLDSPVANSYEMVDAIFDMVQSEQHIPKGFMKFAGEMYFKHKLDFGFDEINSANYIKGKKLTEPVLIINSKADQVTPYHMGKEIYDNIEGNKKVLHTEKNYEHIKFAAENPKKYEKVLGDFISKYK